MSERALLEALTLAAGNMLARVHCGGGARDQLRASYLAAARHLKLEDLGAPAPSYRPDPIAGLVADEPPRGPNFAPPDAQPAHVRVTPSPQDERVPSGKDHAYKD